DSRRQAGRRLEQTSSCPFFRMSPQSRPARGRGRENTRSTLFMSAKLRWFFGLAMAAFMVGLPFVHFRSVYAYGKRLRVVTPGKVYRSGQLTEEGFVDAARSLRIRTILNLQDEFPDPDVDLSFWSLRTIKETELCRQLGVN